MKCEFLILLSFYIGISNAVEEKGCPTEFTGIPDLDVEIKWESAQDAVVTSIPGCISNNTYILRKCQDGIWYPNYPDLCTDFKSSNVCASNLINLGRYCVLVTNPQNFTDQCPPGFLKYYNASQFDPSFTFWYPIRKMNGIFMHIAPNSKYGREFVVPNEERDCYVYQNGTTSPRFCNETHHQLCFQSDIKPTNLQLPEVKLKFDRKRGKLILNVYKPENILPKFDSEDPAIYCFTNADDIEIKSPLKIKRVSSSNNLNVYQISVKYDHPGEYWCELFDSNQNLIKTNRLIAYKKKRGHEYSLRAILIGICASEPNSEVSTSTPISDTTMDNNMAENCTRIDGKVIISFLDEIGFKKYFYNVEMATRAMKIFGKSDGDVDVILHLSTLRNTNMIGEYHKLKAFLDNIPNINVIWFRSSDYCLPERTDTQGLYWRLTAISEHRLSNQMCLDHRSLPYKRKCLGTFIEGAFWEDFPYICNVETTISPKTEQLYNLSMNSEFSSDALIELSSISTDSTHIIPLDVFLITNTLNNVIENPQSEIEIPELIIVDNFIQTIENIMVANKSVLEEAQIELNATDTLLDSIEKLFGEETPFLKDAIFDKINAGEVYTMIKPNFIVHITRPFLSDINGIVLYSNQTLGTEPQKFTEDSIVSMQMDQTFDDMVNDNLELATYVPLELLDAIAAINGNSENITVITTIFYNDRLFNSEHKDLGVPQSKVISVKIPDFGLYLDKPLPLIFRANSEVNESSTCAYWQYGQYSPNKTGQWSDLGGQLELFDGNFTTCYFNHLTHFALLIMSRIYIDEPEGNSTDILPSVTTFEKHLSALTIITIAGSSASLIGILGIFLTAICFQSWRQKAGTKILLQLSLTIILEIVIVQVAGAEDLASRTTVCTIVGICLHYVVLAKFSWMFVSAILQYIRFVKIFQVIPDRLIMKAMLFAWGVPLIPVGLVAGLMPDVYNVGSQRQICYPSGVGLYVGLLVPIALIVACNLIVFILIMKSVFKIEVKSKNTQSKNKLQIYLGILLFFMLGMPWVFGILAEMTQKSLQWIFVYLFCLTATLQGCVLFVFYVTLDKDTRMLWVRFFKRRHMEQGKCKLNLSTYF